MENTGRRSVLEEWIESHGGTPGRNVPGRELSDRERRGGTRGAYERSGDVASGVGHRKARARESVGRRLRSTTRLRAQSAKTDCKLGKGSALDNTKTRFLCDM